MTVCEGHILDAFSKYLLSVPDKRLTNNAV